LKDLERIDLLKPQVTDPLPVERLRYTQRLQGRPLFFPDVPDRFLLLPLRTGYPILLRGRRGVLHVLLVLPGDLDRILLVATHILLRVTLVASLQAGLPDVLHRTPLLLPGILLRVTFVPSGCLLFGPRILPGVLLFRPGLLTGLFLVGSSVFSLGLDLGSN